MPNMNGFQLIEALRGLQAYKFTPILALTTQSDNISKNKAKQLGATGWIVKPFTPERLTELITKLTELLDSMTYDKLIEIQAGRAENINKQLKFSPIPNGKAIFMG